MNKQRASAFGPAPPDLDISGFAPEARTDTAAPDAEKVRDVSEAGAVSQP